MSRKQPRASISVCHSITSSARASTDDGISRPSAFAVLRLITNSNFVGLLDRKVSWLRTLEDSLDVGGDPTIQVAVIWAIREHCAVPCPRWEGVYRRQAMIHRRIDDATSVPEHKRAGLNDERHRPIRLHGSHDIVRFRDVANPS
jgi:hypothetical protein